MHNYSLNERKLIYRILHRNLMEYPALMEGQFLDDLQQDLQQVAQKEGVDISDHGQWDTWLGNEAVPCEIRVANRRVIS